MEYNTHDVVDVEINGETHTAVIQAIEPQCLTLKLKRGAVDEEYETDEVWACDDTAYVTEDYISNVRTPDKTRIHPNTYMVEKHTRAL